VSAWPTHKLGEICEPQTGSRDPGKRPHDVFRYVDISSVDNKAKRITAAATIVGKDAPSRARQMMKENDVIVSMTRPNLNAVALVPSELAGEICSTGFSVLRAKPCVLPAYLFHYVKTPIFIARTAAAVAGALYPAITSSFLRSLPIPVPPLDEQRRIVRLLDRAADIRRRADAARAKCRAVIPALFLDMFGDPTTNPKGWETSTLTEIADIGSGLTKGRKLNGTPTMPTPYLRVANVQADRLDLAEIKLIDATEDDRLRCRLEPGDLLMTEGGDIDKLGRCAMWRGELDLCLHQNHVFRVRMRKSVIPEYARAFMQCEVSRAYFLRVAKRTTGIASINKTQLGQLPVWVPPLALQTAFADQAASIEATTNALNAAATKAEAMAAALSAEVFD
jgi:type I restriction enzyme S subunit